MSNSAGSVATPLFGTARPMLIATDVLEAALAGVLQTLQRQSADIAELRALVAESVPRAEATAAQGALHDRVAALERRVAELESATMVSIPGDASSRAVPIGAFVTAHHESIRGVEARVAACVTQTQMEGERADAERRLATAAAALTDSCASRKALAAAQAAQEAAAAQLVALQGVVSTKVDRADLLRLQAVAAELEAFADFKAGATARLADLGAELAASRAAHDMSVSSLSQLSGLLQARRAGDVARVAAGKADGTALEALRAEVSRLEESLGNAASADDHASACDQLRTLAARAGAADAALGGLRGALAAQAEALRGEMRGGDEALRGALEGGLGRVHAALAALGEEVDCRAYVSSLECTDENVRAQAEGLALLGRKVDVALRFVDWYAAKGDAYEYNAAALERHMNALAVGNRPRAADSAMAVSGAPLTVPPVRSAALRGSIGGSEAIRVPWDASADTRAAYLPLDPGGSPLSIHATVTAAPATGSRAGGALVDGVPPRNLPMTGTAGVRIGGTSAASAEQS